MHNAMPCHAQKKNQNPQQSNNPSTKPQPLTICSKIQSPKSQRREAYPPTLRNTYHPTSNQCSPREPEQCRLSEKSSLTGKSSGQATPRPPKGEVRGPAVGVRSPRGRVAHKAHAVIREVTAILPWGIPPKTYTAQTITITITHNTHTAHIQHTHDTHTTHTQHTHNTHTTHTHNTHTTHTPTHQHTNTPTHQHTTQTQTHTHTHTSCGKTSGDQTRGTTSVKTKAGEGH